MSIMRISAWAKPGRMRHQGRRGHVRGRGDESRATIRMVVAKGSSPVGRKKGPATPWGKPALGKKTRHNKQTDRFIVKRRGAQITRCQHPAGGREEVWEDH